MNELSTASERLENLKEYKTSILDNFKVMKETVTKDITLDTIRLDDESLRSPKVHNRWLSELSEASFLYTQLKNSQKKLELERWKYYMGKQTDQYYAQYGIVHEKSLKTDLDKYLKADDYIIEMSEVVEAQSIVVEFLEKTVKDISNRSFSIQNAINWRKFEAGS